MYSIDGVALDNDTFGWILRAPTRPLSEISRRVFSQETPGRDGVETIPADVDAVPLKFVVQTTRANLATLVSLFFYGSVLSMTADSTKAVDFEYLSMSPVGYGPADQTVDAEFMIRLNRAFWRDASESTTDAVSLSSATVVTTFWSGMSAPVQDAIVRVKGANTTLRVEDSSGAWFTYGEALGGTEYLRFESETGRAYLTTSDVWTGGTEVSGDIDFGGPRGRFEILPKLATGDPSSRSAELTITTATRTSSSIQVRGKAAHLVV